MKISCSAATSDSCSASMEDWASEKWRADEEVSKARKMHLKQWKKSKGVSGTDWGARKRKTEVVWSRLK